MGTLPDVGWFSRKRHKPAEEPEAAAAAAPVPPEPDSTGDPEERSPLADRLRTMDWPKPSEDVRERCLEQIMARVADPDEPEEPGEEPRTAAR